ncbi:MAG TPA: F0F1 ATP synthase subunit A [Pirellulales bacterium]|jgi:F-type H+-transporting ATPase subunit a|nr:F0F1 ATP synthase subunit A [Pirellulales bacterium]
MADPMLHIKDGYFFEVPKFLWRYHFASREEVQEQFPQLPHLTADYPEATAADFNRALSGKIVIPQPFATLKNLYDKESGFAVSKFMILEVVAGVILIFVFSRVASWISTGARPRGKLWNLLEAMLLFVRDQIAVPAMGKHEAEHFTPLLWTIFFFVLACNLFGMIPWLGTPTGVLAVTVGLACVTFATTVTSGMKQFGFVGFFKNLVPHMGLPMWLAPLVFVIFLIELVSLCIKHFILSVRLFANMMAGHLVLLGIMGFIVAMADRSLLQWLPIAGVSIVSSAIFSLLELFVAFLQAYVFAFLSALFIGAAIHHH